MTEEEIRENYIKSLERVNHLNNSIIDKQNELITLLKRDNDAQSGIIKTLIKLLSQYESDLPDYLKELGGLKNG